MPDDDPFADEGPRGQPLPPDDRLWRHPSEVAWTSLDAPTAGARSTGMWAVALSAGLTGAVLSLGVVAALGGLDGDVTERVVERVPADDVPVTLAAGVPGVAASVGPSVVRLELTTPDGPRSGSGVVLRDDGTLLTNAHVLAGATRVVIVRADGTGVAGRVAGADRATDVAVVVVDDPSKADVEWVPAVLGSLDRVEVGETAIAIGSPTGLDGGPSVTVGVVSALGRRVAADGLVLHDLIQTDAPIDGGASGGALCDGQGVVVGLMTAVGSTGDGGGAKGYAIPADVARAVAAELLAGDGELRRAWLGIEGADLATTEASVPGVAGMGGVRVVEVDDDGPAALARLQPGDVVVAIDGVRLSSMSDLVVALRSRAPGDVVRIDVLRAGELLAFEVELAERP